MRLINIYIYILLIMLTKYLLDLLENGLTIDRFPLELIAIVTYYKLVMRLTFISTFWKVVKPPQITGK